MPTAEVERPDAARQERGGRASPAGERQLRLQLMQVALGYWRSQILFTAQSLGVFEALRGGPLAAAEVARRCGGSPKHVAMLLDGAAAIGLLKRSGAGFENAPIIEQFLVGGASRSMADWVRFMAGCYRAWGGLEETVRTGRPVAAMRPDQAEASTRSLILAMHDWALGPGAEMVRHLDLTGRRRLLDVGAGSGAYSMLLAERYPALEAVCFDLPGVVPIAAELISARGLQDRVTTRSGSYLTDDFGSGFDVVLLSNMLHQEDAQVVKSILRKAAAALVDGGQLVIQAAFLGGRQAAQTWAALQSLQLSLFYEGGRNYSQEEMLRLVRETGFSDARVKRMSLINSDSLILATKERKTTP